MIKLLDSHLYESGVSHHLRHLIVYISRAVKYINYSLQAGDLGSAGTINQSGEEQVALDVMANKLIMDNLMICRLVNTAMSEEEEDVTQCECENPDDKFSVCFDPLDGSSLVDTNLAIGSVFGIYPGKGFKGRTGRDQVAALYAVYGPRTTLVYTVGKGVHEFTLNDVGEFTLTGENLKLKEDATHFAPGNLRVTKDDAKYKALIEDWMDKQYTLRYSGGMTPDINHILSKGQGVFTYPPEEDKYPDGKLRLLFECAPMAMLAEQAGGSASNGEKDILDIEINELHQRTPIYIGSKNEVKKAVEAMN